MQPTPSLTDFNDSPRGIRVVVLMTVGTKPSKRSPCLSGTSLIFFCFFLAFNDSPRGISLIVLMAEEQTQESVRPVSVGRV